jgi:hypothetical protein
MTAPFIRLVATDGNSYSGLGCSPVPSSTGVVTTMAAPGFFFDEIGDRPSMNEGPTGEAGAPNLSTFFDDPFFEKCRGDRPCRCKSCKPSLAGAVL